MTRAFGEEVWGRKVARLPPRGTLLFATDLQGNLKDYEALKALYAREEAAGHKPVLLFAGDMVHGPSADLQAPGAWPEHLGTLCPATPFRDLAALIAQRIGYTEPGVFDYPNGWALSYYLFMTRRADALRLYLALRDQTYTTDTFAAILGDAAVSDTEAAWHAALATWCASASFAAPSLGPLSPGSVCETVVRVRDVVHAPPAGPTTPMR